MTIGIKTPKLDEDSLERLLVAMQQARNEKGLAVVLDLEDVFSSNILDQFAELEAEYERKSPHSCDFNPLRRTLPFRVRKTL